MSSSRGTGLESQEPASTDGVSDKPEVKFNMVGQIVSNKNPFKKHAIDLAKTHVGLIYDNWRKVPTDKKDDIIRQLQDEVQFPLKWKYEILVQIGTQWKTWKKNIRKKHFKVNTSEAILAMKDVVPEGVLVSSAAWRTFVESEAREEKIAQREKAKENRSKKTDATYLGRRSYAEVEEKWPKNKPKPSRVELYVQARTNPLTNEVHPGAVADLEEINRIRSSQDESTNASLDTDALSKHFGKDKRGRTRGVGSVSRTRLKYTEPFRDEFQKVKDDVAKSNDILGDMRSNISRILNHLQGGKGLGKPNESRGSDDHVISEKSIADQMSPYTSSSRTPKYYHLQSVDGRKTIALVMIEKVSTGAIVHGRPMRPYEVKVNVIKVLPGMHAEILWLGTQGCEDTIGGTEGGFLVWPQHLIEEIVGDLTI